MPQQIVRTEDVVECLDDRIYTSNAVAPISVIAGEAYSDVLTKIEAQVCSPAEKLAIALTLTSPSASNPVVLKDDLVTYYPAEDLGDLRDAVNDIVDLPLMGNQINDLRPVLTINAIYRWDGSAWVPFIKTGTIDHTQLSSLNGDSNYLHISISELSSLITQSHSHTNQTVLDAIFSIGSGIIISAAERSRIPTNDEKAAMVGSSYLPATPPSSTNRFVTSIDPRLNTVKNPYVTFGTAGSGTTYQGDTIAEIQLAFNHIASGDVPYINAIEILPDTYLNDEINYLGLAWTDDKAILIESLAFRYAILEIAPQPAGSNAFHIAAGSGRTVIRGVTFSIGGVDTLGMLIDRDNTIIEDCTFSTTTGSLGVRITANNVNLRRCIFQGNMPSGIEVLGDDCYLENCRLDLNDNSSIAISVEGDSCLATSCVISKGIVTVGSSAKDALFNKNRMTSNTSFIDHGVNTRWLGGVPQDYQQAYIGRTRSVGTVNSLADFRGTTEAPFIAALADPYTTEIEIFDGTYTFANPVIVPAGKSLKVVRKGTVNIVGGHCFSLNSSTKLYGFSLSALGATGITSSNTDDVEIKDCILTVNAATEYAISAENVTNFRVTGCKFSGTRGVNLIVSNKARITHNIFSTSIYSLETFGSYDLHYAENTEEGSVCRIGGDKAIIRGNHFLGGVPTKVETSQSLWVGNYPPEANNTNGIDNITLPMGDLLSPIATTGASRTTAIGTSVIAFTETGLPTAATLPIQIGARIDRTQGFHVNLTWTSPIYSGGVKWEVSVVFRDRSPMVSDIGTPTVRTIVSPRTQLTVRGEETATLPFTASDFGYIAGVDPTHVSLIIRRLGDDVMDSMGGVAYLTEASITLARD